MHERDRAVDEDVVRALSRAVGAGAVRLSEPMRDHTTFRIGGPADVMCAPRGIGACVEALDICAAAGVPLLVMGNGSNLLVGDRGVRGVVVVLRENLAGIAVAGTRVLAEAGALLRDVAAAAAAAGLSGLEAISGIPAAVGGACFMNAGAYERSTGEALESLTAYVPGARGESDGRRGPRARGAIVEIGRDELDLGYRRSLVSDRGLIVLRATFALERGDEAQIRAAMADYRRRREAKQPLDLPSAGSTFKRPAGHYAGKLIMDAGLRGLRVGAAQVSEKHGGFVVNTGGASAAEVSELISLVQREVRRQFRVDLEPEVRRVGEF